MGRAVERLRRLYRAAPWVAAAFAIAPLAAHGTPSLISVTPLTADVGSLAPSQSQNVMFAVTNIAAGDVWVTWGYRGGAQQFTFVCSEPAFAGRSPYVIHPGETCTGEIGIFAPLGATGPGQTLVDFFAQSGAQVVTATVTWNAETPPVTASPTPIIVGPAQMGRTITQTVTLTNNSDATAAIGVQLGQTQQTDCDSLNAFPDDIHGPQPPLCAIQRAQGGTSLSMSVMGCQSVAPHATCKVLLTYSPHIELPTAGGLLIYTGNFQSSIPITAEATPVQTVPGTILAVEFVDKNLLHFFVTADPSEIASLDAGQFPPWVRTGRSFWVYPSGLPIAANESPVCRYFTTPTAGFETHFYSALPQECDAIPTLFPGIWTLETDDAFGVQQPDNATGACPSGTSPLFRLYNGGPNVNHRYVTDLDTRALLVPPWIPEGYGPLGVGMCVPQ
ncbi:MAG TPA: hypothetical protein VGR63_09855 [Casimicrobiaceae bacterium]|jgi:hypothetical protein|nr:hypothetical protein [Casimicrobiaceae bacterium]